MENNDLEVLSKKVGTNLKKYGLLALGIYFCLMIAFYFLAGDQLRFRDSVNNIGLLPPETETTELIKGNTVEQIFVPYIQRLEQIGIQWATYDRINSGKGTMELIDTRTDTVLIKKQIDVRNVENGEIIFLQPEEPIEDIFGVPLKIRIYANSSKDKAATVMMNSYEYDGQTLSINGEKISGTLCFTATGQDYIWLGLNYWKLVITGVFLLVIIYFFEIYRLKKGEKSYILHAIDAMKRYRFLIRQLVSRDFKTKYKRSVLGVLWSFLNPLLMMIVQYFIFSTIFKSDINNYPVYLLLGIVTFNFFSEACGMSLTSIVGNAPLITKVYMPKYIYPLTRVISSVINLLISLIPLLLVMLITGLQLHKAAILSLYFLCCVVIFSLGVGLILSSAMVFFRDTQFLWGVVSTIWMYATPIFYPETILPQEFKVILDINPLYHFLKGARLCILDGISPEPLLYIKCFFMAVIMLLIGAWVFRKSQDRFVLYL